MAIAANASDPPDAVRFCCERLRPRWANLSRGTQATRSAATRRLPRMTFEYTVLPIASTPKASVAPGAGTLRIDSKRSQPRRPTYSSTSGSLVVKCHRRPRRSVSTEGYRYADTRSERRPGLQGLVFVATRWMIDAGLEIQNPSKPSGSDSISSRRTILSSLSNGESSSMSLAMISSHVSAGLSAGTLSIQRCFPPE